MLLLVAALVGMGARRLKLPYTLALVLAGLVLGFVHLPALSGLALTPEVLLLLLLPPLLFEAAFRLHLSELRRNLGPVLFLAVPGVVLAVTLTALISHVAVGAVGGSVLSLGAAFLFATVISATDPISVLALFKQLGVPRRLYVIVEGESLANDGIAVVLFTIVAAVLGIGQHGDHVALATTGDVVAFALVTLIRMTVGGILVGTVVGGLASVITKAVDDPLIETTITSLVAWGSFFLAEELHLSGVLSTVAAGMVVGSFGGRYGMSPTTRLAVEDFWEYMGFLSNSFIFLLIGIELDPSSIIANGPAIVVGFVAVLAARALVIYASFPLLARISETVPVAWRHVMVWGGLRGSLSMVLVVGLPADLPERGLLVSLVFGVVGMSLLLQGLTMTPLMRWLKMATNVVGGHDYEVARGRALASAQVLRAAESMNERAVLDDRSYARLRDWYLSRETEARMRARALAGELARPERMLEAMRTVAVVERQAVRDAENAEVISAAAAAEILAEIDQRVHHVASAAEHDEGALIAAIRDVLGDGPGSEEGGADSDDADFNHDELGRRTMMPGEIAAQPPAPATLGSSPGKTADDGPVGGGDGTDEVASAPAVATAAGDPED